MGAEDPDQKSIQSTHARDLRSCTTSTLFASFGMGWARETLEEPLLPSDPAADDELGDGSHTGAIPILAGPGPNKVNWDEEGDPDELIPVQTPPSSFGSSMYQGDDGDEDDEEDEGRAVSDYCRKGDRYVADLAPILSFDALVAKQRGELGIEPPQALRKYLRAL
ncbi:hypothetical protein L1887_57081 [Cichorium endivia]|nr:hypothetical protein L1887_57081 [Cichorium endivia]